MQTGGLRFATSIMKTIFTTHPNTFQWRTAYRALKYTSRQAIIFRAQFFPQIPVWLQKNSLDFHIDLGS